MDGRMREGWRKDGGEGKGEGRGEEKMRKGGGNEEGWRGRLSDGWRG